MFSLPRINKIVKRRYVPHLADVKLAGVPPLLQRLYLARGVRTEEEVNLSLGRLLPPNNLGGVAIAAQLLADALSKNKHITIIGDYDADGATASALSVLVLKAL
ncbi:hypothetical protein TI03_06295, partial [Achromatium sp. WMS1]